MEPTDTPQLTEAARNTLKALRREFKRCSRQYRAIYHELWKPHCEIPIEYDGNDVGESFRKAFAEEFDDGWQEWEGPDDASFFGRYFGSGEGLEEFRTLEVGMALILGEIDFLPSSLGKSSNTSLADQWLPEQGDRGYDDWLMLLYRLGLEYPSPLLWCKDRIWRACRDEDAPLEALRKPESGAPYPLFPYHVGIAQPLFSASIAAIDIILGKGNSLLLGVVSSEKAGPQEEVVTQAEEGIAPPVLEFRFDGAAWRLQFDTGKGIESGAFPDLEGFRELQKLLSQPHKRFTPSELQDFVFRPGDLVKEEELEEHDGIMEQDQGVTQEKADDIAIDDVEKEIANTEERLKSCLNPNHRQDLNDHLERLKAYRREVVAHPPGKRRKRIKREWPSGYGAALNTVGVRISRARKEIRKKMPEFGEHLRRAGQKDGLFVYPK